MTRSAHRFRYENWQQTTARAPSSRSCSDLAAPAEVVALVHRPMRRTPEAECPLSGGRIVETSWISAMVSPSLRCAIDRALLNSAASQPQRRTLMAPPLGHGSPGHGYSLPSASTHSQMSVGQLLKKSDGLPHWLTQSSSETDASMLVQLMAVSVSSTFITLVSFSSGGCNAAGEAVSARAGTLAVPSRTANIENRMVAKNKHVSAVHYLKHEFVAPPQ